MNYSVPLREGTLFFFFLLQAVIFCTKPNSNNIKTYIINMRKKIFSLGCLCVNTNNEEAYRMKKNVISIYACGGAGINIATQALKIPSGATGFPDIEITLVDTSDSNIDKESIKDKNIYLIPGLDGSGKDRRFGYENAAPHIVPILRNYKPKDFSIIIFSLSGGSGSTIGPLLVKELIERDQNVFCFVIGNLANGTEAENSLKTIATLQGISSKLKKPIVAKFYENDDETPRGFVDIQIENDIRALSILLSGMNIELDDEDIHNFLYYNTLPSMKQLNAQLVDLVVYHKKEDSRDPTGFIAIAVASLLSDKSDPLLLMGQPYGCVGFMPPALIESTQSKMNPFHFILTNAHLNDRIEKFNKVVRDFELSKEQIAKTANLKLTEGINEDGFVL